MIIACGTGLAAFAMRTKKVSASGGNVRHLYTDIEARRRTQSEEEQKAEVEAAQREQQQKPSAAEPETEFATTTITRVPRFPAGFFLLFANLSGMRRR